MFLDFFTPSPKQLKNWLRFANVGFNLCTQISVSEFNCRMVFCVIATLMLGKWKAPIDCLGNDVRNIAAENPSTHHPAWFFPSKWLLYLHLDGALFKGCYRDQRENFQSLQAMSCWLLSHWRLVILHATCVPCFCLFVSSISHICLFPFKLSLMSSCFWGFLQSAIETALPCNIDNPTLNM